MKTLYWAAQGKTVNETASIIELSINTISSYRQSLIEKLEANNITHAVALGKQHGLIG